jgi:Glycosyltransferase
MKILAHSNACWAATGYGNQIGLFAPRLKAAGHDVAVSAFYGLGGAVLDWEGIRHYPGVRDSYGNDVIELHAAHHFGGDKRSGLVLSLLDVWVLNHQTWRGLNTAAWVPVDHDPVPPQVAAYFEQTGAIPIAMSRFGQKQLAKFDPLYVPHGIDTKALAPVDKAKAREAVSLPGEAFVVGMVAANKGNPSRKAFPEAFEAFARFRKDHPEALLYLHTEATGVADGVNLPELLQASGIPPEAVRWPDQHRYLCVPFGDEHMANLYSSMDVLLAPSKGEGFGLPLIEAQSCGVPVITTDFSACPEVGKVGWHVGGKRVWTYQNSWQFAPDVDDITVALEGAHSMASGMAEDARAHALTYDVDRVMTEYMLPALAEVQARINGRPAELRPVPVPEPVAA